MTYSHKSRQRATATKRAASLLEDRPNHDDMREMTKRSRRISHEGDDQVQLKSAVKRIRQIVDVSQPDTIQRTKRMTSSRNLKENHSPPHPRPASKAGVRSHRIPPRLNPSQACMLSHIAQ
jgi:hypothetical protein